ncbi:MAG: hypothetical protein MUF15_19430 [Acidobacteria bacterium]|nr:hypothetical protein [Acidobacteriota bacterium]
MSKTNNDMESRQEDVDWYDLSLAGALHGMDDEVIPDYKTK